MLALAIAALMGIPAPTAVVVHAPCPTPEATGACASRQEQVIYAPANVDRFALEHERGHLFDAQYLDGGERLALRRAMRLPLSRPWQSGTGLTAAGLGSPSERFADLYAACRLRMDPDGLWESAYDYQPTRREFKRACGVVRRASRDYGDGTTK